MHVKRRVVKKVYPAHDVRFKWSRTHDRKEAERTAGSIREMTKPGVATVRVVKVHRRGKR